MEVGLGLESGLGMGSARLPSYLLGVGAASSGSQRLKHCQSLVCFSRKPVDGHTARHSAWSQITLLSHTMK